MKVYIVQFGYYEDQEIAGVFSTKTLAKKVKEKIERRDFKFMEGIDQNDFPYATIEEWIVDKE